MTKDKDSRTELADTYRHVAHDELSHAEDDRKMSINAHRQRTAIAHALLAMDGRLAVLVDHLTKAEEPEPENPPHEHAWRWHQNVTSKGAVMAAIEVCECGSARTAEPDSGADPDEALSKELYEALWGTKYPDDEPSIPWLRVARLARERIYAEPDQEWVTHDIKEAEQRAVDAEKRTKRAEADVERLTRERDEAQDALGILVKRQTDDQSKIERLTHERDEAREVAKSHVEDAWNWRRRYDALREDVEQERPGSGCSHIGIEGILRRDDEWGRR